MPEARRHFGELLVAHGVISKDSLPGALAEVERTGRRLGEVVVDLGFATEEDVLRCLGVHLGYPVVRLEHTYVDPAVARSLPEPFCRNEQVLPLYRVEGRTVVAVCDPLDIVALDEVGKAVGTAIEVLVAGRSDLRAAIDRVFAAAPSAPARRPAVPLETPPPEAQAVLSARGRPLGDEGIPVAKILEGILERALSDRVSAVHFEPKPKHAAVRFRIDGVFHTLTSIPLALAGPVLARLKMLARLDVGERVTEPVEGRFHLREGTTDPPVEVRLAIAPTIHGERAVLKVIRRADALRPVEALGFEPEQGADLKRVLEARRGLVLVSGPTGSGKTTALYSLLGAIDRPETNIVTAEDPVEYPVPTFNQMALPPSGTPAFESFLRAIERQGPDVVMLSEVRDRETTAAVLRLAESGRLVLTSLHADDAVTAYWPLFRWGADAHAVASVLVASIAVRLVRLVCPDCREAHRPAPDALARLGAPASGTYHRGRGCDGCHRTGYRGRTGLFEVFAPASHVRDLVAGKATSDVVRQAAADSGMTTLREAGRAKAVRGFTTPEEVLRVL
jgi:type IV pilus assembly protein PilB